jgi:hypothetical protein
MDLDIQDHGINIYLASREGKNGIGSPHMPEKKDTMGKLAL